MPHQSRAGRAPAAGSGHDELAGIDAKNNKGYATAVDYLGRIRPLAQRAGEPALFVGPVADIRANHKPKRNLMALLDRNRW